MISVSLKEMRSKIVKGEGAWSKVDPELGGKIKSLLLKVKEVDPRLTVTAVIQYPVSVSRIETVNKEDGSRHVLAIGSAATPNDATPISAEKALKNLKKRKNPFAK